MKWISNFFKDAQNKFEKKYDEFIKLNNQIDDKLTKLQQDKIELRIYHEELTNKIESKKLEFERVKKDKKNQTDKLKRTEISLKKIYNKTFDGSIEWLADQYADFHFLIDEESYYDTHSKSFKTHQTAYNQIAKELKNINKELKKLQLENNKLKSKFIEIEDEIYIEEQKDIFDGKSFTDDEILENLLQKESINSLNEAEIIEKSIQNYYNRRKVHKNSSFYAGQDYERYIGYLYECKGYNVKYFGIKKRLEDRGIDLICKNNKEILLIQCKRWKPERLIREKHINQLFGTSEYYRLELSEKKNSKDSFQTALALYDYSLMKDNIKSIFITTGELSEEAKDYAKKLNIEVKYIPFQNDYPKIKCNIGESGKIFHLPYSQQYDNTNPIKNGGCFVHTVQEALNKEYRKAFNKTFK